MENMQVKTGAQAPKNQNVGQDSKERERAPKKSRAELAFENLVANNLGIYPRSVVFDINSNMIEDCVMRFLEKQNINTNGIMVRAILKHEVRGADSMAKAASRTALPYIVVLFKHIVENEDYERVGGTSNKARANLIRVLKNFRDNSQFRLKDDVPLNSALKMLNYGMNPEWEIQKKANYAYTVLDSDGVTSLMFNKTPDDIKDYVFDFIDKPKSRMNLDTRRKEFIVSIAVSRNRPKSKPQVDPINFIR